VLRSCGLQPKAPVAAHSAARRRRRRWIGALPMARGRRCFPAWPYRPRRLCSCHKQLHQLLRRCQQRHRQLACRSRHWCTSRPAVGPATSTRCLVACLQLVRRSLQLLRACSSQLCCPSHQAMAAAQPGTGICLPRALLSCRCVGTRRPRGQRPRLPSAVRSPSARWHRVPPSTAASVPRQNVPSQRCLPRRALHWQRRTPLGAPTRARRLRLLGRCSWRWRRGWASRTRPRRPLVATSAASSRRSSPSSAAPSNRATHTGARQPFGGTVSRSWTCGCSVCDDQGAPSGL